MPDARQAHTKRPNLMVTGASGSLGHWICRMAVDTWCVHGIHWQHPIDVSGVNRMKADLNDTTTLDALFSAIRPQAVIHAAAIAQPALCEADPHHTQTINADLPKCLSTLCADRRIPFLFTSTDLVFDGLKAPYAEDTPPTPVTVYGRQKAQAEAAVLEAYPGALVCRMPLMIGIGPRTSGNFSIQMLSAIQKERPIQLFTDEFRTPVDFHSAAQGVLGLLGRSNGLVHLGGRSRISRYGLGLIMARKMGIAPTMLKPVSLDDVSFAAERSPDCTLNSDKAYALGFDPMPLPDAVQCVVDQFNVISNV